MTIFTEVEGIVNSRPLTAVSDDVTDLEALTPNHFLIGRSNLSLSPNVVYKTNVTNKFKALETCTIHDKQFLETVEKGVFIYSD